MQGGRGPTPSGLRLHPALTGPFRSQGKSPGADLATPQRSARRPFAGVGGALRPLPLEVQGPGRRKAVVGQGWKEPAREERGGRSRNAGGPRLLGLPRAGTDFSEDATLTQQHPPRHGPRPRVSEVTEFTRGSAVPPGNPMPHTGPQFHCFIIQCDFKLDERRNRRDRSPVRDYTEFRA